MPACHSPWRRPLAPPAARVQAGPGDRVRILPGLRTVTGQGSRELERLRGGLSRATLTGRPFEDLSIHPSRRQRVVTASGASRQAQGSPGAPSRSPSPRLLTTDGLDHPFLPVPGGAPGKARGPDRHPRSPAMPASPRVAPAGRAAWRGSPLPTICLLARSRRARSCTMITLSGEFAASIACRACPDAIMPRTCER